MGFFRDAKDAFVAGVRKNLPEKESVKSELKDGARVAGEAYQATKSYVKEKYNQRYGGGEYREARIKENKARAEEAESRAKLYRAQNKYSRESKKGQSLRPRGGLFGGGTVDTAALFGNRSSAPNYDALLGRKSGARPNYESILGMGGSKKKPDLNKLLFGGKR